MIEEEAYWAGFSKAAEDFGLDPNDLAKCAGMDNTINYINTGSETGNWESNQDFYNRIKGMSLVDRLGEGFKRSTGSLMRYSNPMTGGFNVANDISGNGRRAKNPPRKFPRMSQDEADALVNYFNSDPDRLRRTVSILNSQRVNPYSYQKTASDKTSTEIKETTEKVAGDGILDTLSKKYRSMDPSTRRALLASLLVGTGTYMGSYGDTEDRFLKGVGGGALAGFGTYGLNRTGAIDGLINALHGTTGFIKDNI